MQSGPNAPLPRPAPAKRWISWRGEQKPILALALPDYQTLERIADPGRVKRGWTLALDRAARCEMRFVSLPEGLWHDEGTLPFLAREAAARGLGIVVPLSLRDLPRAGNARLLTLDRVANHNPALIVSLDLSPLSHTEDLDPILEEELPDLLRDRGIPYLCTSQDPLGSGGRLLRRAGFTASITGLVMPRSGQLDPWLLHASCLAARMPDRPCCLSIATGTAPELREALSIGLSSGMGLLLLSPQGGSGAKERAEDEVLGELSAFVRGLPRELEEPQAPKARSLLFRESNASLVGGDERRNADIALPSLRFLHRLGFDASCFLFEEQRREPPPEFLHVPAQGPLREDQWMRIQLLCQSRCRILITGLCLGERATRDRLEDLGLDPTPLPPAEMPAFAHWMRFRPILDTHHQVQIRTWGQGTVAVLDRPPENDPGDPWTIPGLRDLLPDGQEPPVADPLFHPPQIRLVMPSHCLSYDGTPRRLEMLSV